MHEFTWIGYLSDKLFGGKIPVNHGNIHIYTASIVALIIISLALLYRKRLTNLGEEAIPTGKFSLKNIFQVAIEGVLSLMEGIIGKDAKKYFPLIGTLFIYIFVNNIIGLIPGFLPATENTNTNYAMALTVFLYYNYVGIKEQGIKNYVKHFMGPIWWLAPLMLVIELVGHIFRPVSLGIRLFGNMYGDHVVLSIFSELAPYLVPIIFMALGLFVSFIQAFVFSLLSSVYIGLAVAHEEH